MLLIQPTVGREGARLPGVGVDNVDLGKLPGSSEATVVMGHDQLLEPPNIRGVKEESVHLATLEIVLRGSHDKQRIVRDRVIEKPQRLGERDTADSQSKLQQGENLFAKEGISLTALESSLRSPVSPFSPNNTIITFASAPQHTKGLTLIYK